jgi:Rha family phage regulatory protein
MSKIVNFSSETSTEDLGVVIRDQRVVVSSRDVARVFEKDHHKVLRDIRELGCSREFRLSNFGQSSYINEQGREMPEYLMTRDGFTLLAMGYTGPKAMKFKEAYIFEFNRMERALREQVMDEAELLARLAANMAEFQKKQRAINGIHSARLVALEERVTAQSRVRDEAVEYLRRLPEPSAVPPAKSPRILTYQRTLLWARRNGLSPQEAFNYLYREFAARYHVDLKTRAKNRKMDSVLKYAERDGFIDEVYVLACHLFPAEDREPVLV